MAHYKAVVFYLEEALASKQTQYKFDLFNYATKSTDYAFDIRTFVSLESNYIFDIPIRSGLRASLHSARPLMYGGGILSQELFHINSQISTSIVSGGRLAVSLKRVTPHFTGSWIVPGTLNVSLFNVSPTLSSTGGDVGNINTVLLVPKVFLLGVGNNYSTVVVSSKDGSVTHYAGSDYISYVEVDGVWFGVNSDGIFLLDGDDVRAQLATGYSSFNSDRSKHMCDAYVAMSSIDNVELSTVVNDVAGDIYIVRDTNNRLRIRKVNLGRGRRFDKAALCLTSVGRFTLDEVTITASEGSSRGHRQQSWVKAKIPMVLVND